MKVIQCFILILVKSYLSLTVPGQLRFEGSDAFIELDSQPLSCSITSQSAFSISFDVKVKTNSTILFVGVSGSYTSTHLSRNTSNVLGTVLKENNLVENSETKGDPLALLLYFDRPYVRLIVLRLTDHAFRFYRHHAMGYFDNPWTDWHKVSIATGRILPKSRSQGSRMELVFSFDIKTANHFLQSSDLLWPSRSILREDAIKMMHDRTINTSSHLRVHINEFFMGMPPKGTISHRIVETVIQQYRKLRNKFVDLQEKEDVKEKGDENPTFPPFQGSVKNLLISSSCDCASKQFGPSFISKGNGVQIDSVCDTASWPITILALEGKAQRACSSDGNYSQPCGCSVKPFRTACICPRGSKCSIKASKDTNIYLSF